jgi:hypothetical protein
MEQMLEYLLVNQEKVEATMETIKNRWEPKWKPSDGFCNRDQ